MQRPDTTITLRHLALCVQDLSACEAFYVDVLGMKVEWRPDEDNIYLTSGYDNLALHKAPSGFQPGDQRLDHMGFIVNEPADVDAWYEYMVSCNVPIMKTIKTHRDGARSFYCADPDGNVVQIIYHPPIAGQIQ